MTLLYAILAVLMLPTAPATDRAADDVAVRALVQRMTEGWTAGSGTAFAAAFSEDAEYVTFDGTRLEGRPRIAELHQGLFDARPGSRLQAEVLRVRFLGPDVAVMGGAGGVLWPGQVELAPDRRSVQTFVAARQGGEWRIVAFQNTRLTGGASPASK